MCGINGIFFKNKKVDSKKIQLMNKILNHRGPDDNGFLSFKNFLLGHTRLSILDLSSKGSQPMSVDNRFWISYNGEIYNYKDIKTELEIKNYKFYSDTDTEVVLNAYKEWGENCFEKFNGEWALAILDTYEEKLIVCRDGIGFKPCFIYEDNEYFSFSSEIKSFSALKNLEFNNSNFGINHLSLQNCCKTIFDNVSILRNGSYLIFDFKTANKTYIRWDRPLRKLPKINAGYKENVAEYFDLLYKATKDRLASDVKIGTSLSGGLDSSAIFSLLNIIDSNLGSHENNLNLNPIIINYNDMKSKSEAIELAKKFQRKFTLLSVEDESIYNVQSLLVSMESTEEYFMQASLYKNQKRRGISVSIDGHGSDEFLGYPSWIPNISVDYLNNIINLKDTIEKFGDTKKINQFNRIFGIGNAKLNKVSFNTNSKIKNLLTDFVNVSEFDNSYQIINDDLDDLENFTYSLSYTYLNSYCGWFQFFLNKWDRASMSNSVEVRMPFLDNEVRLFSLALSSEMKFKNNNTKTILRDAFKDIFPKSILNQNFKQGLKKQEFKNHENYLNFVKEVVQNKDFKNFTDLKYSKILSDLNNKQNLDIIWEICKYYLLFDGFRNISNNTYLTGEMLEKNNYLN